VSRFALLPIRWCELARSVRALRLLAVVEIIVPGFLFLVFFEDCILFKLCREQDYWTFYYYVEIDSRCGILELAVFPVAGIIFKLHWRTYFAAFDLGETDFGIATTVYPKCEKHCNFLTVFLLFGAGWSFGSGRVGTVLRCDGDSCKQSKASTPSELWSSTHIRENFRMRQFLIWSVTLRRIAGCHRHEKIRNAVPRGREKTSGTGAAPERGRKLHRDRHESQTTTRAQIAREREWKQPQARASSSCCCRTQGSGLVRTARTHRDPQLLFATSRLAKNWINIANACSASASVCLSPLLLQGGSYGSAVQLASPSRGHELLSPQGTKKRDREIFEIL